MRRSLTCVAVVALGVSALSACGGDSTARGPAGFPAATADAAADDGAGGGKRGMDGGSPAGSGTTTTRSAAPTTTTPPYSFDGSVPPPDLRNTGTDYVAIARSFDRYIDWLVGHNPDRQLLDRVFFEQSDVYSRFYSDLSILAERDLRMFDLEDGFQARVTSTRDGVITLMLTDQPVAVRVVDRTGTIIDEQAKPDEIRAIANLTSIEGRWLIAAITPLPGESVVKL